MGARVRVPDLAARGRTEVGDAARSARPLLGGRDEGARRGPDAHPLWRSFRGWPGVALGARRALLAGDIVQVIPDRSYVSFMYSYPNLIPMPPSKVKGIARALEPYPFDTIYGAWWGRVIPNDGSAIVRRSAERYVQAVTEPGL